MSFDAYIHGKLLAAIINKFTLTAITHTNKDPSNTPASWRKDGFERLDGSTGYIRRYLVTAADAIRYTTNNNGGFDVRIDLNYDVKNTNDSSWYAQPGSQLNIAQGPPTGTPSSQAYDAYIVGYDLGVVQPGSENFMIAVADPNPPGIIGNNKQTVTIPFTVT